MYIWVLLATLMVALNFYNLAPRRDLENIYNETRVVTLANRFRHEHLAFKEATECFMIGTNRSEKSFLDLYKENAETVGGGIEINYTSKKFNLPIGYQTDHNQFGQISHNIICVDDNGKDAVSCSTANKRYAISIVPLEDRWVNKKLVLKKLDKDTPDDSDDIEVLAPVSVLTNYLAKAASRTKFTGWTWYDGSKFHLEGFANAYSVEAVAEQNADGSEKTDDKGNTIYKAQFKTYEFPEDIINKLKERCEGIPCLYAADLYKTKDISGRCATLKSHVVTP